MTQDNYKYRTDPFFLRNQFSKYGKYGIPIVPKPKLTSSYFDELRLIGFDKITCDEGEHYNRMVHFFLYDYKFERIWEKPETEIEILQKYMAVLTPDFSMYTEFPPAMLLYNVFRNRWCGAFFASKGIKSIPTVNFGLPNSYDFCFEGIEKGSTVALSTYMVRGRGYHDGQKDFFMAGYNEMLRRIEPEKIICYHEPFPEMKGDIVYVNYDLSSWRHMEDDAASSKEKTSCKNNPQTHSVIKYGYVEKQTSIVHSAYYPIVKHNGYVVRLGAGSALSTSDDFVDGEKIDVGDRNTLPENAQKTYDGYQKSGWKGNFSGQTSGTGAGGLYRNIPPALPTTDADGNRIIYREFDVNNYISGQKRDAERFVFGSDGSVYYTDNHYETFMLINE